MKETWYVLTDGTYGDPCDIRPGADGVLRHKDGRAVAYAPHGPRSRSVDPVAMRAKAVDDGKATPNDARAASGLPAIDQPARDMTAAVDKPAADDRELKPAAASGKGYRTRGGRTD